MNRKKLIAVRSILIILTLAVMGVIFLLSADTAEESTEKSEVISDSIVYRILASFDLTDEQIEKVINTTFVVVRKTAHFAEYAGLGFLLSAVCVSFYRKRASTILISQIIGTLYAVSDEIHQYFVPGRSCQISDMILDACGVLFGVLFLLSVCFMYFKIKQKKRTA